MAFALGLVAAVIGGAIWGVIAGLSGYVLGIVSFVIGLAVAAAVRRGAGRVTPGLIVMAVALTLLGVFIGDVIGITIVALRLGLDVTPIDVIALYPEIVASAPGDTAIAYFFGLFGAVAAASRLYREMKRPRFRRTSVPGPWALSAPGAATAATGTTIDILGRGPTKAAVRVKLSGPPAHVIDASYETTFGGASVTLDGQPYRKVRVWGRQKMIDVPLDGPAGHTLRFRFYGTLSPQIDVHLDGQPLATV